MRGGPSSANGAGNGKRIAKAGIFQPTAEISHEFPFATVKMCAATDVEQQAVGCIAGHQRRVTQAPVGNGLEQSGIRFGVFGHRIDAGVHRAGLCQCKARRQAKSFGGVIDGNKNFGIAAFAGDDKWRK